MVEVNNIRQRQINGLAATWAKKNPVLLESEIGHEIDTNKFKFGDGVTSYNDLPYFVDEVAIQALIDATIAETPPGADSRVGDLGDLTTTEQSTIVGAINEVNTPLVPLTVLYENAKAG